MLIASDFDETLAGFVNPFLSWYNALYKTNYSAAQLTKYRLSAIFGKGEDYWNARIDEFAQTPMFADLPPVDGCIEALDDLSNHDLVVVTARIKKWAPQTYSWLGKNAPGIFYSAYFIDDVNSHSEGKQFKAEKCSDIGADVMVEDNLDYAVSCAEKGVKVYLLDNFWNQGPLVNGVERVFSWKEIVDKIKRF